MGFFDRVTGIDGKSQIQGKFGRDTGCPLTAMYFANIEVNRVFMVCLGIIGGTYIVLILAMLAADTWYVAENSFRNVDDGITWKTLLLDNPVGQALADPKIRYPIWLSLISCTLSALISLCAESAKAHFNLNQNVRIHQ